MHSNLFLQCYEHNNATSIKDKGLKGIQLLLSHAKVANNNSLLQIVVWPPVSQISSDIANEENIYTMLRPQENNKFYTNTHLQDVTNINDVIDSHICDQLQ